MGATIRLLKSGNTTLEKLLETEAGNLRRGISLLSIEQLERAVEIIEGARRVFLVGQGVSTSLCSFLDFRFRRMQIDTRVLTHSGKELYENFILSSSDDAVVGFGFFRCSKEILRVFDYAKTRSIPSIAVTHSPVSELALRATATIVANRGPVSLLNSLVVPMAILNALVIYLAERDEKKLKALRTLDEIPRLFHSDNG